MSTVSLPHFWDQGKERPDCVGGRVNRDTSVFSWRRQEHGKWWPIKGIFV